MRVFAVGDVCGNCGCRAVLKALPELKRKLNIDMVIINGENSAENNGIDVNSAKLIFAAGADVITGGNHTLRHREIHSMLDENSFLLRPHNITSDYGSGYCFVDMGKTNAAVINLSGQVYLEKSGASNPFLAADELLKRAESDGARHIFVDFHAEATSEKRALGFYLDGKITALFGTHTHIQTADSCILPNGTGYITDLGMTGTENSVLGVETSIIVNRLKNNDMSKFVIANGKFILNGCVFETDEKTGKTVRVQPVYLREGESL